MTSLLMSVALTASVFAGCSKTDGKNSNQPGSTSDQTAQSGKEFSYPMQTSTTLKYWVNLNSNVSANFKNLGDTPLAKEFEKRTGIKVEYQHPPAGQAKDTFNLMVASDDLPDLVEYNWLTGFPGGPELAMSNNIILKLNDSIDKYGPNLKKYLEANPEIDKAVKTDAGNYYGYPFVMGDDMLLTTYGPAIRTDWLKELGLQSPETIDDWYNVLKAFKEKKNATAPLSYDLQGNVFTPFVNGIFIGAYGITKNFFVEDGKVKFGPAEPAYKEFLATMSKWYKEGLLDKNFASNDLKTVDSNILNGLTGVTFLYPGSGIGRYLPALQEKDPNADMGPTTYPVLKKGDRPKFSSRGNPVSGNSFIAISAKSKNIETAMRWLDYGYTEEGNLLYNFGIEGVSYKMENGYPKMLDEVLKNPDKLSVAHAWSKYARGNYSGPFVQRKEYIEQYMVYPQQKDALKLWSDTDAAKYLLPPVTPTKDESAQYAKIMNDLNTYIDEYSLKVIMGNDSIENFDKYMDQVKKLNVAKAIEIQQAALDRYNKR